MPKSLNAGFERRCVRCKEMRSLRSFTHPDAPQEYYKYKICVACRANQKQPERDITKRPSATKGLVTRQMTIEERWRMERRMKKNRKKR